MGKKLVIVLFLASLALAVRLFVNRDTTSVREQMEKAANDQPSLILGDFTARRYQGKQLFHQSSGRRAAMVGPNVLEVTGGVKAWQMRDDGREQTLAAEKALVYFSSAQVETIIEHGEVDAIQLQGFVKLDFARHALTTEAATYVVAEEVVRGDKPVRVAGPARWFTGRDGFRVELKNEELEMFGPVQGMVQPHVEQKRRR